MTTPAPISVLFTHFGDEWLRGSEILLLDLMKALDPAQFRPIVWCNNAAMAQACREAGFITQRSDFAFYFDAGSPGFSLSGYRRLIHEGRALVRQHDVRVLHANSAAPTQWLLPITRSLKLPLLTHLHIDYLRRSRFALLLHQADLLVGVSSQVLEALRRDGVDPARLQVIYNGIDFGRLTARPGTDLRPALGIPPNAPVIAAVGSLIRRKGYDLLLQAAAQIPTAHLIIAGDGAARSELNELSTELGIINRVHFLGGAHQPISDVYASCDIFAAPSRAEAFGLVLVEAAHAGLPVVATTVGGIPEVVLDGQTGILVPPNDVASLADALTRLINEPDLRAQLGTAGRARAESQFSAPVMAAAFSAAYERLAKIPHRSLGWMSLLQRMAAYRRMIQR